MKYIVLTVTLFITELLIALYIQDSFFRPFFGDFLATILLYTSIRVFIDDWLKAALSSLFIRYLVESLQYLKFVHIFGLSKNELLSVLLGTTFSWLDVLAYTLSFLLILYGEKHLVHNKISLNAN